MYFKVKVNNLQGPQFNYSCESEYNSLISKHILKAGKGFEAVNRHRKNHNLRAYFVERKAINM